MSSSDIVSVAAVGNNGQVTHPDDPHRAGSVDGSTPGPVPETFDRGKPAMPARTNEDSYEPHEESHSTDDPANDTKTTEDGPPPDVKSTGDAASQKTNPEAGTPSEGGRGPSESGGVENPPIATEQTTTKPAAVEKRTAAEDTAKKAPAKKAAPKKAPAKKAAPKKAAEAQPGAETSSAKAVDGKKADEAVNKTRDELAKIDQNDGKSVVCLVAAGVHLVALQDATETKKNWTERVKRIPVGSRPGHFLNPRTARRLQELGKSRWGKENGTPGSKILRLLADLHRADDWR